MSVYEYIGGSSDGFTLPGATMFERLRARREPSPTNPRRMAESWDDPDRLELRGALASSSSMRTPDTLDVHTTSTAYLTIDDPTADVRVGDRIRAMPDDGRLWLVAGFPSHDVNAFTAWRPTLEIQLTEYKG